MFQNIKRHLISIVSLSVLLVPSLLFASPFSTDNALEVFPTNEVLEFETSVNQKTTETFSIKNTSEQDKVIIVKSYPKNGFQYLGSSFIKIAANTSTTLSIDFETSTEGNFNSEIKIQHQDTQETKTIQLRATTSGNALSEGVTVSSQTIDFDTKEKDSKSTANLIITNNNAFDININTNTLDKPFSVLSKPTIIKAKSSENITLEFNPTNINDFRDTLVVSTSDSDNPTFNIVIRGESKDPNSTNQDGTLNLSSTNVSFNNISNGTSISKVIEITNPNSFDVEIKLPSNLEKPFKATLQNSVKGDATIRSKTTKRLVVVFEPTQNQYYEDSITISTNLPNNPSYKIELQGNSIYRSNNGSNNNNSKQNSNSNNNVTFTPKTNNPNTSLNITRNSINPDIGEISYFNFNLGTEFDDTDNFVNLSIKDNKVNKVIYTENAFELKRGQNNWKIKWNGKNFDGNSALAGNFTYEVNLRSRSGINKKYQGSINVVRNLSHIPEKITQAPARYKHCLGYTDVNYDSNLCDAISFANDQELLKENQTRFYPNQKVTRSQALSSLVKLFDLEMEVYNFNTDQTLGFDDLNKNDWIMPFIKTVQKYDQDNLILSGYINNDSKNEFKPEQEINRAELYKWFFEIANLKTQEENNYLMDYYVTAKPFSDTKINSSYDWFTPYADIAKRKFNKSNFAKKYFKTFNITEYTIFCPEHAIDKEEFMELIYETKKTNTVEYR